MIEGEGSIYVETARPERGIPAYPTVAIGMSDLDTIERLGRLLRASHHTRVDRRHKHFSTIYVVRIRGYRALRLIMEIRPFLSARRKQQADTALAVMPKEELAKLPLYDFGTDTR